VRGPITVGLYRTRGGQVIQITETGSFAYGKVGTRDDFWHLEDGKYVPARSRTARKGQPVAGPHKLDLVERVKTKRETMGGDGPPLDDAGPDPEASLP